MKVLKFVAVALLGAALVPAGYAGATATGLVGSSDVANNSLRSRDIRNGTIRCIDLRPKLCELIKHGKVGPKGERGFTGSNGPTGQTGGQGNPGASGPPGDDALTRITSLPGPGFDATNSTCELTPDGVKCGPYADGGAAGGSLYYDGLNGLTLDQVASLVYKARYTSDGDTGGVGVPYLRIFTEGDAHDAIFSPNTQPPDSDTAEGPFHTWVATSGLWRYDDDSGSGGPGTYGVNGAPYSTLIADHGSEIVSGIYITTGFTAGTNLESLLRSVEVNGERFVFEG